MARPTKIGRNDPCPCLSGEKYKDCCLGKTDWEAIPASDFEQIPYLSVRGRNLLFVTRVADALQMGTLGKSRKDYKAAFTAKAVREIHEALVEVWPRNLDITSALERRPDDVSGLYIGDYGLDYLKRAIVRHSVYANRIILFDPFIYPYSVKDEFNPLLNPEEYRTQTLKNVNFWFSLAPWIEAGIVSLIRAPGDFDPQLNLELLQAQMAKFEKNEELQRISKESVDEFSRRHQKRLAREQLFLGAPDLYLRQKFEELNLGRNGLTIEEFLKSVHEERDHNPDFLEPMGPKSSSQFSVNIFRGLV
jgi:hypothetical protein